MDIKEHLDPVATVEGLLSELFQKTFQNDGLRHHLGLSQISQGSTAHGYPLWYLWLADRKGAYSLSIEDGQILSSNSHHIPLDTLGSFTPVSGQIIVRYFPDIQEDVFDSLSCFEQIVRMSASFDSTGTPTFEGGREMAHGFYVAGQVEVVIYGPQSEADFFCSAPERWCDYRPDGLALQDEHGGSHQIVNPGEIDRDFPGWELTLHLFHKVIASFCSLTGQVPHKIGFATKPSVCFEIDTDQIVTSVADPGITDCRMGVSFVDHFERTGGEFRDQAFKEMLFSDEYHSAGMWRQREDVPSSLRYEDWWTIIDKHWHTCSDPVCSCYKDEKDLREELFDD